MVLTIEISQLQFDPFVQSVQFILPSTSLPWRRGWFPWSCMSKTMVFLPVAVHVVVDVPVVLWLPVPQVRMVQTMQYTVEALQFQSGLSFLGRVHRYTAKGSPSIREGKGWRGRR